jgi:hypothetical protein
MKCLRVYADEKGESHFSEMEIAMPGSISASPWLHDPDVQSGAGGEHQVSDVPCRDF